MGINLKARPEKAIVLSISRCGFPQSVRTEAALAFHCFQRSSFDHPNHPHDAVGFAVEIKHCTDRRLSLTIHAPG
jgi:hypothetical protein